MKPADKAAAREAAVAAVGIRMADAGRDPDQRRRHDWHSLDLDAVARSKADFVVVPRAISAHLVRGVAEAVTKPALAMIETAAGVLAPPRSRDVASG